MKKSSWQENCKNLSTQFEKLHLLIYKHFLIQRRNNNRNFLEILIFLTFTFPFCFIDIPNLRNDASYHKPMEIDSLDFLRYEMTHINEWKLVYCPKNELVKNLMNTTKTLLQLDGIEAVNTSEELVKVMASRELLAGLEFENFTELPNDLVYKLRLPSESRVRSNDVTPFYYREGFLSIQNAVARSFIDLKCKDSGCKSDGLPSIRMHRFPNTINTNNFSWQGNIVGFLTLLAFFAFISNTVRFITIEKEKQLIQILEINGVSAKLYWTSWLIRTSLLMIISSSFIVAMLKISISTDWTVLWLFLFVYSISISTYCLMFSALFSKARTTEILASFGWIALYVPFWLSQKTLESKWIACICSNTAMAHGFRLIFEFEGSQNGVKWDDLWKTAITANDLSLGLVICYMLGSSLLYTLIALCSGQALLIRKFISFEKIFSSCCDKDNRKTTSLNINIESDPPNRIVRFEVNNLSKIYSKKTVVKNLTLKVFDEEITVLLGCQGAGKTTVISLLAGIICPSSGKITLNRNSIGYCPQHNYLFDELTVRENFEFFGRMKGLSKAAIEFEINKYAALLKLESKMKDISKNLTDDMKRKLSVAIALCGSKLVFLDEPTTGMDYTSRHAVWNLLRNEAKDRTIFLTTHRMDEAHILGDRVAIMIDGNLEFYGTPYLLKKHFNGEYRLVCTKTKECNEISKLLSKFIPDIEVHEKSTSECIYILPMHCIDRFENMFKSLESHQRDLGVSNFTVTLIPMEEILSKIATNSLPIQNCDDDNSYAMAIANIKYPNYYEIPVLKGPKLYMNQIRAMFKKMIYYKRHTRMMRAMQLLFPFFLIIISIWTTDLMATRPSFRRDITLSEYGKTITLLETPETYNSTEIYQIFQQYRMSLNDSTAKLDEFNENIKQHCLDLAKENPHESNTMYLTGMSQSNASDLFAWFKFEHNDPSALSLNLIHNAMIQAVFGTNHSIHVVDFPLPIRDYSRVNYDRFDSIIFMEPLVPFLSCITANLASFNLIFLIRERNSKMKFMQIASGQNVCIFWMARFLYDFADYFVNMSIIIFVLILCQSTSMYHFGWYLPYDLMPVFTVLFIFGFSMLPLVYISSLLLSKALVGFILMISLSLLQNIFTIIMLQTRSESARRIFLTLPHYSLSYSLENISKNKENVYAWNHPGIGRNLAYMAANGVIFFTILFTIECRLLSIVVRKIFRIIEKEPPSTVSIEIDDDVLTEVMKVDRLRSIDLYTYNLVLNQISKYYGKTLAVNEVSLAVKSFECIGILGDDAGKTSILKMLTGDESISCGEVYVQGSLWKTHPTKVNKVIGYCPQFDSMLENFTGLETLEIFALLRGIPQKQIAEFTECISIELELGAHLRTPIRKLSIENKRKISIAVALMGNPLLILLDEPTIGMGRVAKQHLWRLLSKVCSSGRSIVLTSRSMEECETVCTRLAIIANGEFQCLGSIQHLKEKFCKGFCLIIKMIETLHIETNSQPEDDKCTQVKDFVNSNIPNAYLQEEYHVTLKYHVMRDDLKWSTMFGIMEAAKLTLPIDNYSISQITLEHLFWSLAYPKL